jgi:hypothetical protein
MPSLIPPSLPLSSPCTCTAIIISFPPPKPVNKPHQRFCQNPTLIKFLNKNKLVGRDNGCLDIAPYDTKKASDPRRRAMGVVVGPETQFRARQIGCESETSEDAGRKGTHRPTRPFFHHTSERIIDKLIVGNDIGRAQTF